MMLHYDRYFHDSLYWVKIAHLTLQLVRSPGWGLSSLKLSTILHRKGYLEIIWNTATIDFPWMGNWWHGMQTESACDMIVHNLCDTHDQPMYINRYASMSASS